MCSRGIFAILIVAVIGVAAGCTVPPPGATVFVVAYTDVDGIAGYDPAGGDVLIAELVDTNDDGVISVGDTVTTGRYPKDFTGSQFGSFAITSHVVQTVAVATAQEVVVTTGMPTFVWRELPQVESYSESTFVATNTAISDDLVGSGSAEDAIQIRAASPSAPVADLDLTRPGLATDDSFIDVEIRI